MLIENYSVQGAVLGAVWDKTMNKTWLLPSRNLMSSTEGKREVNGKQKTIEP